MKCQICNSSLIMFLSLGTTPLANRFLKKEELDKKEPRFPLELCLCQNCKLVQLSKVVPAENLFRDYVYVSSTAKSFRAHFSDLAKHLKNLLKLNETSLAVDIGSNDGVLLKPYKELGINAIGVEPASNVAKIASESGLETINAFFDSSAVDMIISSKGNADIITAANVFAHIKDISGVINNVRRLLKKDGVFVIEIQYFVDTVETMTFDNIYHEHIYYYTLKSLNYFFKKHNMDVFRIERINTHGGSLRVFVKNQSGNIEKDPSADELLKYEDAIGVDTLVWYKEFGEKVHLIKSEIIQFIRGIKSQNKRIAGYGAPAKGNTLLNFCGITNQDIDYIVEDSKMKVGLYTPGTHIPVVSPEMLNKKQPDFILILPWNFAKEITEKTKKFSDAGVKYILPLPTPKII